MMRQSPKFSPEVVERAVRMVFEAKDQPGRHATAGGGSSTRHGSTSAHALRRSWLLTGGIGRLRRLGSRRRRSLGQEVGELPVVVGKVRLKPALEERERRRVRRESVDVLQHELEGAQAIEQL